MGEKIRALTNREQLEWLLQFLCEQKKFIEEYIQVTENELKLEKSKKIKKKLNRDGRVFFDRIIVKIILQIKLLNKI